MRYMVKVSYVDVIGLIWMPATTCAMRYKLTDYDVENIRRIYGERGRITRESVEEWLALNSGDFQGIADFSASIEDGEETLDFPWSDEESELIYSDCMFGDEE